jgi:hypothetical protein
MPQVRQRLDYQHERAPQRGIPVSLALTIREGALIRLATIDLLRSGYPDDPDQQIALGHRLANEIERIVPRVAQLAARLRHGDVCSFVIRGLPAEERLTPVISLSLSLLIGEVFSYLEQGGGKLVMPIVVKENSPRNTNTSREEFGPHTDDAYVPADYRVTWITLCGIRNPPNTLTGYAAIETAAARMPTNLLKILHEKRFQVRAPLSFNLGDDVWSPPTAILTYAADGALNIAWPSYATRALRCDDAEATRALVALEHLVKEEMFEVALMPGTFFAFSNLAGPHMRTKLGSGDRLVFRSYVRPDLEALRRKTGLVGHVFPLTKLI